MTEKRYYAHKHLIKEDKVHDKICHRFMNLSETVEHMNMYYQKYTALKQKNEQLKAQLKDCEKRVSDKEVEWLRDNTVWEQIPSNKRTYISTIYHRRNDE